MHATVPAEILPGSDNVTVVLTKGKHAYSSNAIAVTDLQAPLAVTQVANYPNGSAAPATTGANAGGPDTGSTQVTITGSGFTSASTVKFGTGAGTGVTFVNSTTLRATSPTAAAAGVVANGSGIVTGIIDVTVTSGTDVSATNAGDHFLYEAPFTAGSPNTGYVPPASLIVGSGSQTTYYVMRGLGTIFEQSPGCDLTSTLANQVGLQCSPLSESGTSSIVAGTSSGQAGLPVGDVNPYDDYYANAPGTGSGNGRTQVNTVNPLLGGPDGIAPFNVSFGRSSSYKAGTGTLNFVGYATDGVGWVSEACIGVVTGACANTTPGQQQGGVGVMAPPAGATGHWDVTDISKTNLQAIWANTYNCNLDGTPLPADGTNVTMDWRCLQLAENVNTPAQVTAEPVMPIDCYTTQTASGTYGTWQGFLGFTANVDPPCSHNEAGDTVDTAAQAEADHNNLTENQMGTVDAAQDRPSAIYFFGYGRYTTTCNTDVTPGNTQVIGAGVNASQVQGTCIGQAANNVTQYGSINGIYATKHTIQGTGDFHNPTFPDTRVLWNDYGNSTSANPANGATLNFIGSTGFLCRPDMVTEIDPSSGVSYRTEIEGAFTAAGFFPPNNTQTPFAQASISNIPANEVGPGTPYPAAVLGGGGTGFCDASN